MHNKQYMHLLILKTTVLHPFYNKGVMSVLE